MAISCGHGFAKEESAMKEEEELQDSAAKAATQSTNDSKYMAPTFLSILSAVVSLTALGALLFPKPQPDTVTMKIQLCIVIDI